MTAPNITPLPTPPSRSQSPDTFSTDADTFLGALPDFATEANTQADYLDTLAAAVDADAVAAAASAAAALVSENNAEAAAAAAAATADAELWVSGTTYAIGDNVFSPLNYQTYRRITNGAGTTDPSLDGTNWVLLTFYAATPFAVVGNATSGAELRLPEDTDNGSNYVALKAPNAIAANVTFTLPEADGSAGQAVVTDGSGNLSFAAAGGGTINATASGSIVAGKPVILNSNGTVAQISSSEIPFASQVIANFMSSGEQNTATADTLILRGRPTYDPVRNIFWTINRAVDYASGAATFSSLYLQAHDASGVEVVTGRKIDVLNVNDNAYTEAMMTIAYNPEFDCLHVYGRSANPFSYSFTIWLGDVDKDGMGRATTQFWGADITPTDAVYDPLTGHILICGRANNANYWVRALSFNGFTGQLTTVASAQIGTTASALASLATNGNGQWVTCDSATNQVRAFTYNGTAITLGTVEPMHTTTNTTRYSAIKYSINQSAYLMMFVDGGGTCVFRALTVSGTTISLGTLVSTGLASTNAASFAFNDDTNRFYWNIENRYSEGTLSGNTITLQGTILTSVPWGGNWSMGTGFYSRASGIYFSGSNNTGSYGGAWLRVYTTNLKRNNYLGIAKTSVSNGQTVTVSVIGSIDQTQTGMTPGKYYYFDVHGGLTTSKTSAYAGRAITSTALLIGA